MTSASVTTLTTRILRHAVAATCGCVARRWAVEASRSVGGITVRAELRSR
ncbi:hypothetical protein [Nocardioides gansuensis]|nr:hypothetical protein [Nocardioides gansuensis]